jgi:hypothetical protein
MKLRFSNEIQHRLTRSRPGDEHTLRRLLLAPRAEESVADLLTVAWQRTI